MAAPCTTPVRILPANPLPWGIARASAMPAPNPAPVAIAHRFASPSTRRRTRCWNAPTTAPTPVISTGNKRSPGSR